MLWILHGGLSFCKVVSLPLIYNCYANVLYPCVTLLRCLASKVLVFGTIVGHRLLLSLGEITCVQVDAKLKVFSEGFHAEVLRNEFSTLIQCFVLEINCTIFSEK